MNTTTEQPSATPILDLLPDTEHTLFSVPPVSLWQILPSCIFSPSLFLYFITSLLLSFSHVQAPHHRLRTRPLRRRRQNPLAPRPFRLRNEKSPNPPHRRRRPNPKSPRPPQTKRPDRRRPLRQTIRPPAHRNPPPRQIPRSPRTPRPRRPRPPHRIRRRRSRRQLRRSRHGPPAHSAQTEVSPRRNRRSQNRFPLPHPPSRRLLLRHHPPRTKARHQRRPPRSRPARNVAATFSWPAATRRGTIYRARASPRARP